MRILRVRVDDFRGITSYDVPFVAEGTTVVEAPNESGKSSLLDAVDLLLTEKDSSKKKSVREARPAGRDVGSRVEVELTCGAYHLTCVKRFNKQTMTELTVHAPVREQLTGTEAHDRLREILEAEVDLALFEALRFKQGRGLDSVALGTSNVIAARLDEAAGGTGTAGDDDLLARVRGEFETYFTPKGQEGKRLTRVDDAVAVAGDARTRLADRLAALEQDIDQLARLEVERTDLVAERDRLGPEVDEHRERQHRVQRLRQRVAEAQAEVERARARHTEALRACDARQDLVAGIERTEAEVARLADRLVPGEGRVVELTGRLTELTATLTSAEQDLTTAQQAQREVELAIDLLRKRDEADRLERCRARVAQILEEARRAAVFLDGCRLDDDLLLEIRDTADQARVTERALEAGAPGVTITAHRALEVEIDGRHEALAADTSFSHAVEGQLRFDVPGIAGVEVRTGATLGDLRGRAEDARRRRDECCRRAGVADPSQAEALAEERRAHLVTLRRRDTELERALDGLPHDQLDDRLGVLADRVDELAGQLAGRSLPDDLVAADAALDHARGTERDARQEADRLRTHRDELRTQVEDRRGDLLADQARRDHLEDELERQRTTLKAAREEWTDHTLAEATTDAERRLAGAGSVEREIAAELDELDPDQVELLATNAERRAADVAERLTEVDRLRSAAQARLDVVGEEGLGERLAQAEADLADAEREQRRVRARAAAAKALHDELRTARDEAYRAYQRPLRDLIARQGRVVFGDDLEVELDDELKVVRRTLDGDSLDWDGLSSGAKEQLAILSALAAARLAADGGVPLVLDDALGYTDPDRLAKLGAVLGATEGTQLIVLTCVGDRYRAVGGATRVRLVDSRPGDHAA